MTGTVTLSAPEVLPGEVEPDGARAASALEPAESRTVVGKGRRRSRRVTSRSRESAGRAVR
ncbi:hypothetical protein ACFRH6_33730 [Streptomyces sp. NPDC056749]|uniref:hypothetical protein n=1 Tax=Streptomyces sp. NPDC056749 TaxID=3345936 RepID=UPI0036A1E75B